MGAGNLSYTFNRHISLGGGITSLPAVRSTEGQFPYWLGREPRETHAASADGSCYENRVFSGTARYFLTLGFFSVTSVRRVGSLT